MNRRLLFKSVAILCASSLIGEVQAQQQKKKVTKSQKPPKPRVAKIETSVFRSTFGDVTLLVDKKAQTSSQALDTVWADQIETGRYSLIVGRMVIPEGFYTDADALQKLAKNRLDELAGSASVEKVVYDSINTTTYLNQKAAKSVGTITFKDSAENRFTLYVFKKNALIYHVIAWFGTNINPVEVASVFTSLKWTGKVPKATTQPATQQARNTNPGFRWVVNRATCSACGGRGYQVCSGCGGSTRNYQGQNCTWCYGSGRGSMCFTCNGRGQTEQWYQVPN